MAQVTILAGPIRGQSKRGTPRWDWQVEITSGGKKEVIKAANRAEVKRVLAREVPKKVEAGHTAFVRSVDQIGGGDEAVYHPDGSMTDYKKLSPKDGLLGPRCFDMPISIFERKRRAKALRAGKRTSGGTPPEGGKKARRGRKAAATPATQKTGKTGKTARPSASGKSGAVGAVVAAYLAAATSTEGAASWIRGARPREVGNVTNWMKRYGTASQKSRYWEARKLSKEKKGTSSGGKKQKGPSSGSGSGKTDRTTGRFQKQKALPKAVMGYMKATDGPAWYRSATPAAKAAVLKWIRSQVDADGLMAEWEGIKAKAGKTGKTGKTAGKQVRPKVGRQARPKAGRQAGRQAGKQSGGKQAGRQAGKQSGGKQSRTTSGAGPKIHVRGFLEAHDKAAWRAAASPAAKTQVVNWLKAQKKEDLWALWNGSKTEVRRGKRARQQAPKKGSSGRGRQAQVQKKPSSGSRRQAQVPKKGSSGSGRQAPRQAQRQAPRQAQRQAQRPPSHHPPPELPVRVPSGGRGTSGGTLSVIPSTSIPRPVSKPPSPVKHVTPVRQSPVPVKQPSPVPVPVKPASPIRPPVQSAPPAEGGMEAILAGWLKSKDEKFEKLGGG